MHLIETNTGDYKLEHTERDIYLTLHNFSRTFRVMGSLLSPFSSTHPTDFLHNLGLGPKIEIEAVGVWF